jgi:hypothetical protein
MNRLSCGVLTVVSTLALPSIAHASFHLMQIEKIIGSVDGDNTAQAIQLRMRSNGQNFVSQAKLIVVDANGQNAITLLNIGSDVSNGATGDRVLIASDTFAEYTTPATIPDFFMTNLIPPSYFAGGSLKFQADSSGTIYWRLSWGAYGASNLGATTNDADGNFGPPFPSPLPGCGTYPLEFKHEAQALSTTNAADYKFRNSQVATFINNDGDSFTARGTKPTITTSVIDGVAKEVPDTDVGKVRFTRSGCRDIALTVFYELSGTAGNSDYQELPGKIGILPGNATGTITIRPIDDALAEPNETVIATNTPNSAYTVGDPDSGTVTIDSDE